MSPSALLDEHDREGVLWTRPVWRDPRALREVERGVVVDRLRRRAREQVEAAMREAGLLRGERTGCRRFQLATRAVRVAETCCVIAPDHFARLLLANALLAARRSREAGSVFHAIERAASDRLTQQIAAAGTSIALSFIGARDEAIARCKQNLRSPFLSVAESAALTLLVQAARSERAVELEFALDALSEMDPSSATVTAARLLSNYCSGAGSHAWRTSVQSTLLRGGRIAREVNQHLRGLICA